ncbi:MAG: DUF4145 domain-containing protein, partial [Candidatus Dormibacteraeota bacterium]|nr:DUF4145 domain-containing protein [Candidatus Dormibacteraeota bacterium]
MTIPLSDIVAPTLDLDGFNCPWCGAFAHQTQSDVGRVTGRLNPDVSMARDVPSLTITECARCSRFALWFKRAMVFPFTVPVQPANVDLPEDVRADYAEAGKVLMFSPRSSAALLRLAIQKLCAHLGYQQRNLDDAIGAMVAAGLPVRIQRSLDIVRVTGNNAVHPGT